jgi:GTP cyclohydrolase II
MITPDTRQLEIIPSVNWGEESPFKRGPLISINRKDAPRNVIGNYGGQYGLYRAGADAAGRIPSNFIPDYTDALSPMTFAIRQNENWQGVNCIASFDPFGHLVPKHFSGLIAGGYNIRPTIAITSGRLNLPEIHGAVAAGLLKPDGDILTDNNRINVTKIAIEPGWHLPGIAKYYGRDEKAFREGIYYGTGESYAALVTASDLNVFLPAHGETTVYVIGDINKLGDPDVEHAARTHDKCGSSDTHRANICSCAPALMWGYEQAVLTAQSGGVGIIVYTEAEGRGHGVVPKNLVYNARLAGEDRPEDYFPATVRMTGIEDLREQMIMTDVYRWLGVNKIDVWLSGSPHKTNAMKAAGIQIAADADRPVPPDRMENDTGQTEWAAKMLREYRYAPRLQSTTGSGLVVPAA